MPDSRECRICHKKGDLGARAVLLTCGLCKRHSHHCNFSSITALLSCPSPKKNRACLFCVLACLIPPVSEAHILLLLKAIMGSGGAASFGDPTVWLCPRCSNRNREAAKLTIIGRTNASTPNASTSTETGTVQREPQGTSGEVFFLIPSRRLNFWQISY